MLDHEWTLMSPVKASREVHTYQCCVEQYATIIYTLVLVRNAAFVSTALDSCVSAIIAVTPVMFLLPPASGEKITLAVGLLIYNALMWVVLSYFLPTYHQPVTSPHAMLLIYHLVLVCVAIFIAACINALWHKQRSMPTALRRLTKMLACLTCVTCSRTVKSTRQMSMRRLEHQLMAESDVTIDGNGATAADDKTLVVDGTPTATTATKAATTTLPLEAAANDWQRLALALDRVTLAMFMFVCSLSLVAYFSFSPVAKKATVG